MNSTIKTVLFWAVIVVSAVLLWQVVRTGSTGPKEKEIGFSDFLSKVDAGDVHDAMFIGQEVKGKLKDDSPYHTIVPANYPDMYKKLTEKGVPYSFKDISGGSWPSWLLNLAPLVLLGALWFFMIRQMQTGGNKALSFGKSRARLLSMQQKKITFKDVAGVDEAKEELREIIEFLREAQKFQKLGGRIPEGRAAGRASRNRQDFAGSGCCGRGECSFLLDLRLRLCRDVRGRRREPRARPVRAGQEECPLHHLH